MFVYWRNDTPSDSRFVPYSNVNIIMVVINTKECMGTYYLATINESNVCWWLKKRRGPMNVFSTRWQLGNRKGIWSQKTVPGSPPGINYIPFLFPSFFEKDMMRWC